MVFRISIFILSVCLGWQCPLIGEESFILIDGSTNQIVKEFGSNLEERVTPACSFNIALSLMGYETGVLQDEENPVLDFQKGCDDIGASWRASQNPKMWMARSSVWYSKNIALWLGVATMERYLSFFGYGNQDLSAGLTPRGAGTSPLVISSLKISPREQVEFIRKMLNEQLSLSHHSLEMTKTLIFKEEIAGGWKLFGKTGLAEKDNEPGVYVRWFVGWIEKDGQFRIFAYQVQAKEIDPSETIPRTKQLLKEMTSVNRYEDKMKKEWVSKPEIKLVGIAVRTNNKQEADKINGKIFPCIQQYFHQGLAEKIAHRSKPGITFCAYTEYEADHTGDYTYFIGEEVTSFEKALPAGFRSLMIPPQEYAKFTTEPAPMPEVIVNAWQTVWRMSPADLGGDRTYQTDFEIYDERAADHQRIVLDLYIGIR